MGYTCCVPKCDGRTSQKDVVRRFPKDPEKLRKWLALIQREDLLEKKIDNYRICNKHFTANDQYPKPHGRTAIKFIACPSLYLPEANPTQNCKESCSNEEFAVCNQEKPIEIDSKVMGHQVNHNIMDNIKSDPLTAQDINTFKIKARTISSDKSDLKSPTRNSKNISKTRSGVMQKILFKSKGVTHKRIMTRNEVQSFKSAIELRNTLDRISKQCNTYKELLDKALNLPDSDELQSSKLEKTLRFVLSRTTHLCIKNKGK